MSPFQQTRASCFFGAAIISALLFTASAQANVGEAYGFGSRAAALSGAGAVAWGFDGFTAYANPAGLPLSATKEKKLNLSFGLILMEPGFLPINGVVVENGYVSDQCSSPTSCTPRLGNVDTSYRETFGQEIGLSYRVSDKSALGITVFLPINQLAYMDSGEAFEPEYVLYRARTQRPQIEAGYGYEFSDTFRMGAGLHFSFSLTSNASAFLNADPTKPSTLRFSGSMKPKASPYLGFLLTPAEERDRFSIGAVIRAAATSDNSMTLNSSARLLGTLAALDFNFTAASALFYDPWTLELGTSWAHADNARLYAQVDYQIWSAFQAPALQIQTPDITTCKQTPSTTCGLTLSPGNNPGFPYQNVVVPRIGEELTFGNFSYRLGYAYHPSIFSALPTLAGNYLDPPKHIIGAGIGIKLHQFLGYNNEARLDLNASYQALVTQHIDKTPGNEAGNPADAKIGAPGYDAGGKILGGGVSLSLAL